MDPTDPLSCLLAQSLLSVQATPIEFHYPTIGSLIAIAVALLGLFLSAFNSGSEIAFFSLKKPDVEGIADESARQRVERLLSHPDRLLATILIANNMVNVMVIIVLNYAMSQMMTFRSAAADFVVQTIILTFLILLFGEVIPKLYATSNSVRFATFASSGLMAAQRVFGPMAKLMLKSSALVRHTVRQQPVDLSTDDLSHALEASEVSNGDEKELLEGILSFGQKEVSEIMRPRVDVVDVDYNSSFNEVVNHVVDTGYSRLPVVDDNPDNIRGILYAKDLLPYIGQRNADFRWQSLIRPAYFVPETRKIDDLLEDFRKKKVHLAIIVDEYGCTQGIATLEDVLEEIVGDIDDEYDTAEHFYVRMADGSFIFDGKTPLTDFCRITEVDEETLSPHADKAETVAGLLLDIKGDFVKERETLQLGPFNFTVTKLDRYRIDKVRVVVTPPTPAR